MVWSERRAWSSASTLPGGHSSAPRACDRTRPRWSLEETTTAPHPCPPCLPVPGEGGRGPAPRSPTPTPSGILGLMSCKMRRLQLTCTDGAHTRLQHPPTHPPRPLALPPSTLVHLLQTLGSAFSGKHPSDFQPCSWPHRGCPRTLRPHLFHPGSTGGQVGGLPSAPPLPPLRGAREHSPPGWGPEGLYVCATGALP